MKTSFSNEEENWGVGEVILSECVQKVMHYLLPVF